MSADSFKWDVQSRVKKWHNPDDHKKNKEPDEIVEAEGNLLLDVGINRLLSLLGGLGGTAYNNANAEIGVGSGTGAASAGQTDLQGSSTYWASMDAGYPDVSGRTITFRATFGDAEANFAWNEWGIRNGQTANELLNRRVVNLGTKTNGIWALEVDITVT